MTVQFNDSVQFKDLVEIIKSLAWPVVVAIALLAFRKPLARFIAELGGRAQKLSVFQVSVEFAKIPIPPLPWSDPAIYQSHTLIGAADVETSTIDGLFQRMSDDKPWPYLVVDIGTGHRWLISRVFLFTVIFRYLRDLRCVVFVETKDELFKKFLGMTKPEKVRVALAKKYSWLDDALIKAWSSEKVPVLAESLAKDKAQNIVNTFLKDPNIRQSTKPAQGEWTQLSTKTPGSDEWEHTKWLDINSVKEDLLETFVDWDTSHFVDSRDTSASKRNRAMVRRKTPFVALVNDRTEFKGLVDRQGFLDKLASHMEDELGTEDERGSVG